MMKDPTRNLTSDGREYLVLLFSESGERLESL